MFISLPFYLNSYCSVGLRSLFISSLSNSIKMILLSKYLEARVAGRRDPLSSSATRQPEPALRELLHRVRGAEAQGAPTSPINS
jgi:hypothetical protein